jgi:hypothetical protein
MVFFFQLLLHRKSIGGMTFRNAFFACGGDDDDGPLLLFANNNNKQETVGVLAVFVQSLWSYHSYTRARFSDVFLRRTQSMHD